MDCRRGASFLPEQQAQEPPVLPGPDHPQSPGCPPGPRPPRDLPCSPTPAARGKAGPARSIAACVADNTRWATSSPRPTSGNPSAPTSPAGPAWPNPDDTPAPSHIPPVGRIRPVWCCPLYRRKGLGGLNRFTRISPRYEPCGPAAGEAPSRGGPEAELTEAGSASSMAGRTGRHEGQGDEPRIAILASI